MEPENEASPMSGETAPFPPPEAGNAGGSDNEATVPSKYTPGMPSGSRTPETRPMDNQDLVGRKIGAYRIVRFLRRGGMGVVYEARDEHLHRRAALKVISEELVAQPDFVARFLREARVAAQIAHENVINVYAGGCDDGHHYLAMEYIEGGNNIKDLLEAQGPLPIADALNYARQAAEGLAAIHQAGIIHRDIKPGNLLLNAQGRVYVTDYGLAKSLGRDQSQLTLTPMIMGTFPYISPEQCETGEATPSSDVYALGITLYQMLTGTHPYGARNARALLKEIAAGAPPLRKLRPEIPAEVAAIVERMMAPDLERRFANAREAADALATYLGPAGAPRPMSRRRAVTVNAGILTVFIAILYLLGEPSVLGGFNAVWHSLNDAKYLALAPRNADPGIQLISLASYPPEDTAVLAKLIDVLKQKSAAVIGLDIFLRPAEEGCRLKDPESLAPAIEAAGNVVLLSEWKNGAMVRPMGRLPEAAAEIGFAHVPQSLVDGRIRQAETTFLTPDGEHAPSFALALAKTLQKGRTAASGNAPLPNAIDADILPRFLLDYGCADNIPILHLNPDPGSVDNLKSGFNLFENKVVIIGSMMVEDKHYTPLWGESPNWKDKRGYTPGLVLQGVILDNLLNSRRLLPLPWWAAIPAALFLAALCYEAGRISGPRALAPVWIALITMYIVAGMAALRMGHLVLPTAAPLAIVLASAGLGAWRRKPIWKRA